MHLFGAVILTSGIVIRRFTGARVSPYTLAGHSLGATRAFCSRACALEALRLPFFLTLVVLALLPAADGRMDPALENKVIRFAETVYPMMHHRRTRAGIVQKFARRGTLYRRAAASPAVQHAPGVGTVRIKGGRPQR